MGKRRVVDNIRKGQSKAKESRRSGKNKVILLENLKYN
jgi:hypothetical protein